MIISFFYHKIMLFFYFFKSLSTIFMEKYIILVFVENIVKGKVFNKFLSYCSDYNFN